MAALHPMHLLWRGLPAGLRREAFARGAAWLAPRPDQPPPQAQGGVGVGGEWRRASGLGEGARLMFAALGELGVPAWRFAAGVPLPGETAGEDPLPPAGVPLVLHVNAPMLPASLLRLPRGALRGRRIIGYWAWELPVAPPIWRVAVPLVHEIWVPSRFTAAALEPLAPGRVRVVPHAVAASPPVPSALSRADFALPADAFVVLTSFSLASSYARKNPEAALAAFRSAFGDRPDRLLVMKITHSEHWPADLQRLRGLIAGAANVRLETRLLPAADSYALTACADCVLSLHRSEGFGLVPAEAMSLGRAVVATDWSGTTDFLDASCGVPVPCRLVPANDPRGVFEAPGAVWAEADVSVAAAALRDLAAAPERRAALGQAARRAVQERLGTAPLQAALHGIGLAAA
ncbi:MAG TPA: glycosyltransferase [Acetobacteraceae bacterium]|nr:glycosyltransferase [Acetobacteraceae bacterium]